MVLKQFQIMFDNNQYVFYSGQDVTGKVIVLVDSPKKLKGISLQLLGRAEVRWTEHRRSNGRSHTVVYKNDETYFDVTAVLFVGVNSEGQEASLPTGEHKFPFSFRLPSRTPSSFEGRHGHVRFSLRCVMERSWKFNHEARATFSVLSPLDLNLRPELAIPVGTSGTKSLCCVCCRSGPLSVILGLAASGAVSGQALLASCEVENLTTVKVEVNLELTKRLVFITSRKNRSYTTVVVRKTLGTVDPGSTGSWDREAVMVPALPPSSMHFCSIIDLSYHLKVFAKPYGLHKTLEVSLPVTVGTIPFHQHFQSFRPSDEVGPPPLGWNLTTPPPGSDQPPDYDDLPPPSYQQCMQDEPPQDGEEGPTFLPKYPVYMTSFGEQ